MTHAVAGLFDQEAIRYDSAYDGPGPKGYQLRERLAIVAELLQERPGRLLDAGTGPGRTCVEACRRGWVAVGLDLSPGMLALARKRLHGLPATVVLGSVERLPFPAASFDGVVAAGVIGYVSTVDSQLAEFQRVLRPGGRLLLSIPNTRSLRFRWRARIWYPAVRLLKRYAQTSRPPPIRRSGTVTLPDVRTSLRTLEMHCESMQYVAAALFLSRLEPVVPRVNRLVALVERRAPIVLRSLLAPQIVLDVRDRRTAEQ